VLFFDEVDAVVGGRAAAGGASGGESDGGASAGVLATFLTELDGVDQDDGVIVVAATNRPELLDAALLRPGRLDLRLLVLPPESAAERLEVLQVHARKLPLAGGVDLRAVAGATAGFTGAELAAVCREAGLAAMRRTIREIETASSAADDMVNAAWGGQGDTSAAAEEGGASTRDLTHACVTAEDLQLAIDAVQPLFGGPDGALRLEQEARRLRQFQAGAG